MIKEISTEIIINAPSKIVWKILMNFQDYSRWNPFITNIEGNKKIGGKLKITIQKSEKNKMTFKPIVIENKEDLEFAWVGKFIINGLFNGEHKFKLTQIKEDITRFQQSEKFYGILVRMFEKELDKNTKQGFENMNKALKIEVEKEYEENK